jgi:SpoVK/Ycf46/Vps4 family AAA+-type ATPase
LGKLTPRFEKEFDKIQKKISDGEVLSEANMKFIPRAYKMMGLSSSGKTKKKKKEKKKKRKMTTRSGAKKSRDKKKKKSSGDISSTETELRKGRRRQAALQDKTHSTMNPQEKIDALIEIITLEKENQERELRITEMKKSAALEYNGLERIQVLLKLAETAGDFENDSAAAFEVASNYVVEVMNIASTLPANENEVASNALQRTKQIIGNQVKTPYHLSITEVNERLVVPGGISGSGSGSGGPDGIEGFDPDRLDEKERAKWDALGEHLVDDENLMTWGNELVGAERERQQIEDQFILPYLYRNASTIQRLVMLYGPPGTGKTFIAKALTRLFQDNLPVETREFVKLYALSGSLLEGSLVGETGSNIARLFRYTEYQGKKNTEALKKIVDAKVVIEQRAYERLKKKGVGVSRANLTRAIENQDFMFGTTEQTYQDAMRMTQKVQVAVSIIFLDEFESIGAMRNGPSDRGGHMTKSVTAFLTALDGAISLKYTVVVAATNFPWKIDTALQSRFGLKILIDVPTDNSRHDMIINILKKRVGAGVIDRLTDTAVKIQEKKTAQQENVDRWTSNQVSHMSLFIKMLFLSTGFQSGASKHLRDFIDAQQKESGTVDLTPDQEKMIGEKIAVHFEEHQTMKLQTKEKKQLQDIQKVINSNLLDTLGPTTMYGFSGRDLNKFINTLVTRIGLQIIRNKRFHDDPEDYGNECVAFETMESRAAFLPKCDRFYDRILTEDDWFDGIENFTKSGKVAGDPEKNNLLEYPAFHFLVDERNKFAPSLTTEDYDRVMYYEIMKKTPPTEETATR